ncbi:DUF6385 domain-containing protein [Clostridium sp. ZS2-4]|uniref:DUF6385 domain-containing protein n=1 Tax=Clostridium sp. ZS2-4 TaxID=2987703 RepID=UPI00227A7DD3|nr:DUF6385 domain-containing protein [Clostridium sp. ZS2-4]MCY6353850.1 DUF6385 domain-containing protein [Clostridium sp. ZS2-4]
MLTNPTNVYTKDEELIQLNNDIFDWIKTHTPVPPAANVNLGGRTFTESSSTVSTSGTFQHTSGLNISQQSTVTFFVKNTGSYDAIVKLEISPDDSTYIDDGLNITVQAGEMKALVPMIFAKHIRVGYKSSGSNPTNLDIIMQGHI